MFQVVKTGIAQGAQVGYETEAAVSRSPTSESTLFSIVSVTGNDTVTSIKLYALGALQSKKFQKSELTMEVGGWV